MSLSPAEEIHAMLNVGRCPACDKTCGYQSPKAAVMAHLRSSKDSTHARWKDENWGVVVTRMRRVRKPDFALLKKQLPLFTRDELDALRRMLGEG
jgi:hypothetical protein